MRTDTRGSGASMAVDDTRCDRNYWIVSILTRICISKPFPSRELLNFPCAPERLHQTIAEKGGRFHSTAHESDTFRRGKQIERRTEEESAGPDNGTRDALRAAPSALVDESKLKNPRRALEALFSHSMQFFFLSSCYSSRVSRRDVIKSQ